MKKIFLLSIALLFLFTASSSAQLGLLVKGQGGYGLLLKPKIQEVGYPEEKLTKGGIGFSGQLLYRVVGKILSLGVEAGYLACWKDEYKDPVSGLKVEVGLSAIPILGIIQLESPLPLLSPYLQIGGGVYPLTTKIVVLGVEVKDTETRFGVMAAAGLTIPLVPKINLDLGGKLYLIFTEGESTIMLNPSGGISIRF
jgi:hypothetical protein